MTVTIKVEHMSKSYNGITVVDDLTLDVAKGEVFGLLGANGAGKSTTIECVIGTKKSDKGRVSVLGMDPLSHRKEVYERVSVQFQESNYQDKIRVDELCETTQALYQNTTDYKELLDQFGLSDKLKNQVNDLSGGQKQRLFIVLALIPDPDVVFLDELTTGLDARARRDVWKKLAELKKKGLTIFLTSHFMDEVEALCDTICILKKGKSVFYGTVKDAISSSPYESFEDAYLWYTDEEDK
ncbi:MAG: ABC transporter ATP-binding protein [Alkalibacterium sp.]|nr:ABC transporter ATP-binding protein [Alkalibacterium sp.]